MGWPPNLSDILRIVMVFRDHNNDNHFLRIEEHNICKITRLSTLLCYPSVTSLLFMVHPLIQDTSPPEFLPTVKNLRLM